MQNDLYRKIARQEALAEAQRAEMLDVLTAAYEKACGERNAKEAAALARKIRDKLLDKSDKEMSIDRLGLDTSTATKFILSLVAVFGGAWAKYRQALRDLPAQEGFPFNVVFPAPPDGDSEAMEK